MEDSSPSSIDRESTMGRVTTAVKIENLFDLLAIQRGLIPESEARRIDVAEALVDTGASTLSLPRSMIEKLGLTLVRTRKAVTSAGVVEINMFGTVRMTIDGRDCVSDVVELPEECPMLIGQIPLELLDFVVDVARHRLIGNPAHGGEHIIELY